MYFSYYKAFTTKKSIWLFLLFSGLIFHPINLYIASPKLEYAITFIIWVAICIYLSLLYSSINLILLLSLFAIFPSVISGILLLENNMTNVVDFFADMTRFIAPFIGYSTAIYLLGKARNDIIIKLFMCIFAYHLYQFISSIIFKFIDYGVDGAPFVKYGGIGLVTSPIIVVVFMFMYFFRYRRSIILLMLFIISINAFIFGPFIVVSKVGVLLLICQLLFLLYIVFIHVKSSINKLIIICSIIFIIPFLWIFVKDSEIQTRFDQALGTFGISNATQTEGSTSSRIGEIKGVLENLTKSWSIVLFGMGNGAWIPSYHVDKYIKTDSSGISGLDARNYRNNGKYIHHVHSGVFAILNRNGAIGLIFYLYFFYYLIKSIYKMLKLSVNRFKYFGTDEYFIYAYGVGIAFYVISGLASIFPSSGIYGSISWGAHVAMIPIVTKFIKNSQLRNQRIL